MNRDGVLLMYTKLCEVNKHTSQLRAYVNDLMQNEERAVSKRKALHLALECDAGGALTGGSVAGDIGTVTFKQFTGMGLPSGEYDLKVTLCQCKCPGHCRCSHPHVRATTHDGREVSGEGSLPMSTDVRGVAVKLPSGEAQFETFEVDGEVHWMGATAGCVQHINRAIGALKDGRVSVAARDAKTIPWLMFEGRLHELENVVGRLDTMQERLSSRHVPVAEDGWLELFGRDTVDADRSALRVCLGEDYSVQDLRQTLKTTEDLQKSLSSVEAVSLNGDVQDVVGNLCHMAGVSASEHLARVNKLLTLREQLHNSLKERTLKDVVETRVKFLTMAVVDAGLRHEVGSVCKVEGKGGLELRRAKLCRYQLGQIYANNERNERQLTEDGYNVALERMNAVIADMEKLKLQSSINQTLTSNLTRSVCLQKVLEGLSWTQRGVYSTQREMPIIAPTGNFMYEEGRGLDDRQPEARNDAHRMFVSMVNADRQHRLITPMVHRHLLQVARTLEGVDGVMEMYDTDLQPFLGMALGGPEVEGAYGFLDGTAVRTGYNEEKLFNMLVGVMFV